MFYRFSNIITVFGFLILTACSGSSPGDQHPSVDSTQAAGPPQLEEAYSNSRYDISLRMPGNWMLVEESRLKPGMGTFAINILKCGTKAEQELPLQVHAEAKHSYVAIWPHGYGTELPPSQYATFNEAKDTPDLQFPIDQENSKVLQLNDGSAWAYYIIPENPPENWTDPGFIFAQIRTTQPRATCFDEQSGNKIPLDQCDFLTGDRYVREGNIDQQDQQKIRQILESIALDSVKKEPVSGNLIKIEKPGPHADITSPLTVKGKAPGQWFFEGSFRVELVDAAGHTLAETQAEARGDWMTKNFVPFTATLKFNAPDDKRGRLVFHRANPSGLPENADSYSQPVSFPPK